MTNPLQLDALRLPEDNDSCNFKMIPLNRECFVEQREIRTGVFVLAYWP